VLVAPGDAAAMARAVLRLLDDAGLRGRLAAAAVEASRSHGWRTVRGDLYAVYARAVHGSGRAVSGP
jgi:glycosyltransferase involved in cell wall biosynthesis